MVVLPVRSCGWVSSTDETLKRPDALIGRTQDQHQTKERRAEATQLDLFNSFHEVTAEGVGVLTRCVDEGKLPAKLEEIVYPNEWNSTSSADGMKELRAACERRGIRLDL